MTPIIVEAQPGESTYVEIMPTGLSSAEFGKVVPRRMARERSLARFLGIAAAMIIPVHWITAEPLRTIREFISKEIGALPQVLRVIGNLDEDDFVSICTFIDSQDRTARYRVYEHERSVIARFPQISFNFRVVNLKNYPRDSMDKLSEVEGEILYDRLGMISNDALSFDFNTLPRDVSYAFAK